MNYDKRLKGHMDNLKVLTNDALFYHQENKAAGASFYAAPNFA